MQDDRFQVRINQMESPDDLRREAQILSRILFHNDDEKDSKELLRRLSIVNSRLHCLEQQKRRANSPAR